MEISKEEFRKIFLETFDEAFHAIIEPRFVSLEKRFDDFESAFISFKKTTEKQFASLRSDIAGIKDHVYPLLMEIKTDLRVLCRDVEQLKKKDSFRQTEIKQVQSTVTMLKKELIKALRRVAKFEENLKVLRQTNKKKAAR